jgi:hypothetical protein
MMSAEPRPSDPSPLAFEDLYNHVFGLLNKNWLPMDLVTQSFLHYTFCGFIHQR